MYEKKLFIYMWLSLIIDIIDQIIIVISTRSLNDNVKSVLSFG